MASDAASSHARHTLESGVLFYLLGIDASSELIERKANVVSRVRTALLGTNEGDPLVDLIRDPNMPRDVRLMDIASGAITVFQTSSDKKSQPSVPGGESSGWIGKICSGSALSPSTIARAVRSGMRRASPISWRSTMCHHGESHFGQ